MANLLTLFTTTKPFAGHIGVIQRNALASWRRLDPAARILIFGNADGTPDAAAQVGAQHIPEITTNEYSTPLVSAMFEAAEHVSDSQVMCYVNADIILMSDFLLAVRRAAGLRAFLMTGRRWDLDLQERWDFEKPDCEQWLRALVIHSGTLHAVTGMDYFVYPRGFWGALPPLAIGRTAWDNWLIYRARVMRVPVIDATRMVTAIHQNHDYQHHPGGAAGVWDGSEARRNQELAGGPEHAFTLAAATHLLARSRMWPALSRAHLKRRLATAPLLFPRLRPAVAPLVPLFRWARRPVGRVTR